jgi:hypothetical protein
MELFEFYANRVWYDETSLCVAFADKLMDHEHYFTIQRSEESPEQALPDVRNVYIELDNQGCGGYGGIRSVVLQRPAFTVLVTPRMVPYMRGHDGVRISFDLRDREFRSVRRALQRLLRGYEGLLHMPAEPGAADVTMNVKPRLRDDGR